MKYVILWLHFFVNFFWCNKLFGEKEIVVTKFFSEEKNNLFCNFYLVKVQPTDPDYPENSLADMD